MAPMQVPIDDEVKKRDADLYSRREKAGFLLDLGVDGSGLFMKYLRLGSGCCIDVGPSELAANGSIHLRSGVAIEHIQTLPSQAGQSSGMACAGSPCCHRLAILPSTSPSSAVKRVLSNKGRSRRLSHRWSRMSHRALPSSARRTAISS